MPPSLPSDFCPKLFLNNSFFYRLISFFTGKIFTLSQVFTEHRIGGLKSIQTKIEKWENKSSGNGFPGTFSSPPPSPPPLPSQKSMEMILNGSTFQIKKGWGVGGVDKGREIDHFLAILK